MSGSLRQRSPGAWELRVYLGVDADSGRQRWATKTVRGSRRYANAALAEFVAEAGYAKIWAGSVADLLDRWMDQASPNWSATTLRQTASIINHHLKPQIGDIAVTKLTTLDIDTMYLHLLRRGGPSGRALSAATVKQVHGVLHRSLAQAVRWGWVWFNPASTASKPSVPPSDMHPPTPGQVQDLLSLFEASNPAFAVYVWVAACTGARRSQMLGLRWGDVDLAGRSIGFTRGYVDGPSGPVLRATKTHRCYNVALDDTVVDQLSEHRSRQADRGINVDRESFVFTNKLDGRTPWAPNWVTKTFVGFIRRSGVGHFRLHDLRHFMATQMLSNLVVVTTVAQRLGHARSSTTLNVYAHCVPGADSAAAELIGALITKKRADARPVMERAAA